MSTWIILLNVLIGAGAVPLVVAAITRIQMPSSVKALVNLALSAISGSLTSIVISASTNWKQIGLSIATTFIASAVAYYNLHIPLGTIGAIKKTKTKLKMVA